MILKILGRSSASIDTSTLDKSEYSNFFETIKALTQSNINQGCIFAHETEMSGEDDVSSKVTGVAIAGKMGAIIINTNHLYKPQGSIEIEGLNGYELKQNALLNAFLNNMVFQANKSELSSGRMVADASLIYSIVSSWRALEDSESFYTPDEWRLLMQQEEFEG